MNSAVSIAGGLSGLLAQTACYDCIESSVVLLKPDGQLCYRNPAAAHLDRKLRMQGTGAPGILCAPSLLRLLATAVEQRKRQQLRETFYYNRNIPVVLTICARPVIDLDTGAVDGAMLTIGEEHIDFDRSHLVRLQAENSELAEHIKRLSVKCKENERMMRILLSEMPIALILFDNNRRLVQLNRAAEVLFQTPRRQAVGQPCNQYLGCYEQCERSCPVLDKNSRIDLEEITPDSSDHSPHLLRTAVALHEGEQAMVLEAFIDITQRKIAEDRLARYRVELEDIVAERTAKLEQTVAELESFSYSVSHDLRAPLRAVDGFSLALLEDYGDALDDVAIGYINRSRKAAQRMGRLIDDLLQLSNISRRIIQRQSVDISTTAREIVADLQAGTPDRRVEFTIQPDMRAHAEPGLLNVLLTNLIGNAWKFTSSLKDARIDIGSTIIDDENVFYVGDNGIGFDMQYADRLFLPFQVLDTQSTETGNGIGLATVQRIIHRHDGCVWAKSTPGEGATFYFTLQP